MLTHTMLTISSTHGFSVYSHTSEDSKKGRRSAATGQQSPLDRITGGTDEIAHCELYPVFTALCNDLAVINRTGRGPHAKGYKGL